MDRYELRRIDYNLTPDHEALRAAYKDFFKTHCSIETVRAAEESGFDKSLWERLCAMGATTMALPEAARYYTQSLVQDPGNASILSLAFFYTTTSGDVEGAGRYATQIVAKTPDERSARLALAGIAFKHKNYADARKHLALSAKGPFQTLVVSLFDGWAAAAAGDSAGALADMKTLSAQSGAEGLAAFHTALIADYLGLPEAEADYRKAIEFYTQAIELDPRYALAWSDLSECR